MPRLEFVDLGGSINQGRAPSKIGINEYTELENFYQFGGKLRRRGGMPRITINPFDERITGMKSYRPETEPPGGVDMIIAGLTRFGILVDNGTVLIPNQTGFVIPTSDRRWSLIQFKDIMYGLREGVGLVRTDGTVVGMAGIDAPTAAATIADGAAGSIPAASFKAVYTYYNSNNGMESNPSPVSNTLVHAGSTKINWTGITISSNPQVTSRRIYRTLPDQSGEYFLVAEIANNTDTTYTGDDVLAQDLDVAVSQVNGTPPAGLRFGVAWKERCFASDGRDLFHSEDGLFEAFDPDAIIPFFPDDGHDMSALHAFGDRLVVGKTNGIHYLVGSDPETFQPLTLSDRHGCASHHSMQSAEGTLLWLGFDNVYRSDGNNVTGIASVKLKTIIESLDAEAARDAVGTIFPELGWYVLVIPGFAQLIYNYRTDVWASCPTAADIQTMGDFFDPDLVQEIFVADDAGHVYRFNDIAYGLDDSDDTLGISINATATTRSIGAEATTSHFVEHCGILTEQVAESITLEVLSEGTVLKSRTVSLDYAPRWKSYNLSTRHAAKSQTQLRLTYEGETAIEIEGLALDVQAINRPAMRAR